MLYAAVVPGPTSGSRQVRQCDSGVPGQCRHRLTVLAVLMTPLALLRAAADDVVAVSLGPTTKRRQDTPQAEDPTGAGGGPEDSDSILLLLLFLLGLALLAGAGGDELA